LAGDWSVDLSRIVTEVSLDGLSAEIDKILKGGVRGRVVIDLSK